MITLDTSILVVILAWIVRIEQRITRIETIMKDTQQKQKKQKGGEETWQK